MSVSFGFSKFSAALIPAAIVQVEDLKMAGFFAEDSNCAPPTALVSVLLGKFNYLAANNGKLVGNFRVGAGAG